MCGIITCFRHRNVGSILYILGRLRRRRGGHKIHTVRFQKIRRSSSMTKNICAAVFSLVARPERVEKVRFSIFVFSVYARPCYTYINILRRRRCT